MGLSSLPYELKQKIVFFMDTKSLIRLIESGERDLDNNFIWKQKCHNEYSYYSDRIINWKTKYKKLYLTKCIHCHKNTKLFNDFFKVKVCRKCEIDHVKYHTISHTKAKKMYFLTNQELEQFNFVYRINPYNYTQKLKLYLKTDILKYITSTEGEYIPAIQQRRDIRRMYNTTRINKFTLILNALVHVYNVTDRNILNIMSFLNIYSRGIYEKFMRYNNRSPVPVINKALELDFILTYTRILIFNTYNSFEELLFDHLITNTVTLIPLNINEHIDRCINQCITKYIEYFIRKSEVLRIYQEIRSRLTVTNILKISAIQNYIRYGASSLFQVNNNNISTQIMLKTHILLHDFLYVNTDIQIIIFEYNLIGKQMDKFFIYILVLNKWYINNANLRYKMPKELYPLLYD